MSPHLYDLIKLMVTEYGIVALQDEELYRAIIEHRKKFNTLRGIDYTSHSPNRIDFIPSDHVRKAWEKDYKEMRENIIIYGDAPEFDVLLRKLTILCERFRKVAWR